MISKNNIKPLVGSIIIAIALWLIVATDNEYVHQIEIPIKLTRLYEGKTLLNKIPEKAIIELKGKGRALIALMFYNVQFNLDLQDIVKSQKIQLTEYLNFLDLPATFGCEVLAIIEPEAFDLQLDNFDKESKPIMLAGSVGTENGYILLDYHFSPDTVGLSGPRRLVESITYVNTDQIAIAGKRSSFKQNIKLQNPHPGITFIDPDITTVEFNIQRLIERVVYDIPIQVINVPNNLVVEPVPNKLSLKIKGGEIMVADLNAEDIHAEIDFAKDYTLEKEEYGASIVTPENISWIESIPKKFKLKVRRRSR